MASAGPAFFVRNSLAQTAAQRSTNSRSPDIILYGASPAPDPSQFTTAAAYATDYGSEVLRNAPNFVYLRAVTGMDAATGRARLFWAESDLALWPRNWRSNRIKVGGQPGNSQEIDAPGSGAICVAGQPFVWTPPASPSGSSYCCIGWIEPDQAGRGGAQVKPGDIDSWDGLVAFQLTHKNVGRRNMADVSALGGAWTRTANVTAAADPGMFFVGVQCANLPTDGQVGYRIAGPTPTIPPIVVNQTPISNPNMLNMVPVTGWPGGARSSVTLQYRQGATAPPKGASLTLVLFVPESALSEATAALAEGDAGGPLQALHPEMLAAGGGGWSPEPTHMVLVGSQTYGFGAVSAATGES